MLYLRGSDVAWVKIQDIWYMLKKYLANQIQNCKRMPCNFHVGGIHHKAPKVSEQAHLNRRAMGNLHISSLGKPDINCLSIFHYIDIIYLTSFRFWQLCPIQYIWSTFFCCPSFDVLVLASTVRIINGMHEAGCNHERSKIPTGGEKAEADIARKWEGG